MSELPPDPPSTFSYDEVTPLLPGRAEDLYKRSGFTVPFLSAVELQVVLTSKGLPPLRCALEVASIAKASRWAFHNIHQVVHDFPLPDYSPLLNVVAHAIAPIPRKDQLGILGKSLSLCFHTASGEGAPNPEMHQALIDLIGLLSAVLGSTCSSGAHPSDPPPTSPSQIWDDATDMPWDEDDAQPAPDPQSDKPALPAAPEALAKGAPLGPALKKGKGKGKTKPPTTAAPIPTAPPPKASPPYPPCPTSYAMAMAQLPKPKPVTRPSLMISLHHKTLASNLKAQAQLRAPSLVEACNKALQSDA